MEPVLGLPRHEVRLVEHDPRWAQLYDLAAADLRHCLGERVRGIEHIGSTAIPGIDAKPILDLIAAVPCVNLSDKEISDLGNIGYQHRNLDTVPGRLFFAKGLETARTHYLSVCEVGSPFWISHLAFRDALRGNERLAQEYAALKRRLAQQFPHNRFAYNDAKQGFILSIIGESICGPPLKPRGDS
jgi:GrpB-like predicted nucleotidyltransferase (UPF0157 family)